jgi:hypothetical protein
MSNLIIRKTMTRYPSQKASDFGAGVIRPEEAVGLAAQVGGPVLLPGEDGYADECAIYNLNLVLKPALIVGVTSVAGCTE